MRGSAGSRLREEVRKEYYNKKSQSGYIIHIRGDAADGDESLRICLGLQPNELCHCR